MRRKTNKETKQNKERKSTNQMTVVRANLSSLLTERSSIIKSDGQEKSTKILISWQELKNQFLAFFVHR